MSIEAFEIQRKPIYRAERPVRDVKYKQFIKRLPCANCCTTRNIDPCHTGPHGLGTKSSDLSCIPLCRTCHQEFDAAPRDFAEKHGIDIPALIAKLNEFYRTKLQRTA